MRSKDPKIQRSRDPKIQRSRDPEIQRSKDQEIQRSTHPKIQRSIHPKIQRSKRSKDLKSKDPKFQRARIKGLKLNGSKSWKSSKSWESWKRLICRELKKSWKVQKKKCKNKAKRSMLELKMEPVFQIHLLPKINARIYIWTKLERENTLEKIWWMCMDYS